MLQDDEDLELKDSDLQGLGSDMTDEEEMTFSDILGNVMINDEIIITISAADIERTKTGIKNTKAKQAAKMKEDGLPIDTSVLSFYVLPSDIEGMADLKIVLARKSTVRVRKVVIPSGEF